MAIDLGTTAIKCAVYDRAGRCVGEAAREYALRTPRPGWVEVPCATYWTALREAVADLWSAGFAEPGQVAAAAISAQGETLVPVGRDGRELRDAIVWLDARAQAEADELTDRFGVEQIHAVTGQPEMLATWPAAKLLWLARHEPDVTAAATRHLLIEDWLLWRLTGEVVTEGSLATSTCYWNFRTKRWWHEMLEAIEVREDQLPTLVEPGSPVGTLRTAVADELGLPADVLVCAGALDQACGAIGGGNVAPGGFSENTGAAIALCATTDGPRLDPSRTMPCHYHAMRDTYMLHTFTGGGIVLKWFRDQLAADGETYDDLGARAAAAPPGADGLVMLPHLQGAMAPENDGAARGVLIGLTLAHGRGHIARAIMESVAFVVRRNVEVLRGLGVEIDSVRALGGGSRSAVWKQIEADVLGVPVVTMAQPDAGALGAAMLAGIGLGWWPDVAAASDAMVREARVFEPDVRNAGVYEERYATYVDAYDALRPIFAAAATTAAAPL
jgi:xylulokinase